MTIVGCDFHPSYQRIAWLNQETGECGEQSLEHLAEAAEFYRRLPPPAVVGIEASGQSRWFERLLQELGHQLWVGDAAQIRASVVRWQKTDARDAEHLLRLLVEGRFPRIWVPSAAERDLRQLVVHRHKLVGLQTQVKNQLQALALNQGLRRGRKLWSQAGREQLSALELEGWTGRRRQDLLAVLDGLEPLTEELRAEIERQAQLDRRARLLMTHPGVGPITALAFVLTLGPVERFPRGKQVASYLGLAPREHSSGGHQRLGHISKQGSPLMRMLLVEAAQSAVLHEEELGRAYRRWRVKKSSGVAKVAAARKLAVRLYWMLRTGSNYAQLRSSHAGQPESSCGRRRRPVA